MERIATYLPVLCACAARTKAPVLELGCGHYSTPLLHCLQLAKASKRRSLVSAESDIFWLNAFRDLERKWHRFVHVQDWAAPEIHGQTWGVAFVDHGDVAQRARCVKRLLNLADVIVCHDTQAQAYGYEPVFSLFEYRYDFKRYPVWTTVVSNRDDLEWLRE